MQMHKNGGSQPALQNSAPIRQYPGIPPRPIVRKEIQIMASALSPVEFRKAMEDRIKGRTHSDYPMVNAIAAGTATPEQIGYLGVLFYHFTKETPQVISTIHSRCPDPKIRRRI